MKENDELSLDELEHVGMHPNNEVNHNEAIKHSDLFREKQIEELKVLKEEIEKSREQNGRSR